MQSLGTAPLCQSHGSASSLASRRQCGYAAGTMTDAASTAPNPPEPPSLEALAERYLRLWQEQWAVLLSDPAASAQLGRMAAGFGRSVFDPQFFAPAGGWPGMGPMSDGGFSFFPWSSAAPDRPAPVPPAADAAAGDVDELTRRIADLEARLRDIAP